MLYARTFECYALFPVPPYRGLLARVLGSMNVCSGSKCRRIQSMDRGQDYAVDECRLLADFLVALLGLGHSFAQSAFNLPF